ncbi:hypothetical protein HAHE_10290 [Haloferula helveola]|uniref:PDZ domain-containing protein n=1 Tax=Haloferula helveola TaxID=490095 RepID=A0ABM7R838_9BACT|nr:hypothetical protein HAHE_10290 [Haloferula helveola]
MNKTTPWIPVVAAVAVLAVNGAGQPATECKRAAEPAAAEVSPGLEAAALQHLLRKHGAELSEIEKSALGSAISKLDAEATPAVAPMLVDLGVAVEELDDSQRRHLQPQIEGGLSVTRTSPDGLLTFWGVEKSDLIVSANGQALHNARELLDALDESVDKNKPLLLDVIVQGNRRTINLRPLGARAPLQPGAGRFWQFMGC